MTREMIARMILLALAVAALLLGWGVGSTLRALGTCQGWMP